MFDATFANCSLSIIDLRPVTLRVSIKVVRNEKSNERCPAFARCRYPIEITPQTNFYDAWRFLV